MRHLELTEQVKFEPGLLLDVGVLGSVSKNGRTYSERAMKKAVRDGLYEGYNIYLDHAGKPTKGRTVAEHFGSITGVKYDPKAKRIRAAKLSYLRTHPFAAQLEESLARGMKYFGLSHNADGVVLKRGTATIVDEITKVKSVDLVSDPATGTLLEQADGAAAAPEGGADAAVAEAFATACMAVLSDTALSKDEKLSKISDIIDAQEGIAGDGEESEEAPATEQTDSELAKVVAALQEQVKALQAKPAPKYLKAKTGQTVQVEEQATEDEPPADPKDRKKWYHQRA